MNCFSLRRKKHFLTQFVLTDTYVLPGKLSFHHRYHTQLHIKGNMYHRFTITYEKTLLGMANLNGYMCALNEILVVPLHIKVMYQK